MRIRIFLALFFAAVTVGTNAAPSGNIAHGVQVVVIDAGHGGKFPGAHYAGVYEKDLTLKVALKLGRLIEAEMPGVKVVYTRRTDKALGADLAADLQARADIANKAGGDVFISIHVNAARSSAARGVETLIMGESSKEQRYNENALFENNREDLIDMSDERTAAIVRAYIQNLQFTYGQYSMAMARCIQNSYLRAGRHSRGIKPQLLRVLYATDMPGVLTEIGFLSNAQEAAYMKSEKGQNEIARSLLKAVKDYSTYVLSTRGDGENPAGQPADTSSAANPETPAGKPDGGAVASDARKSADARKDGSARERAAAEAAKPSAQPGPDAEKPTDAAKEAGTAAKTPEAAAETSHATAQERASADAQQAEAPLRYAVQVLASSKPVPLDSSRFGKYRGKVKQYASAGNYRYKYCVSECGSRAAAQRQLAAVRRVFPDAFVVCCRGTQIVK